MYVCSYDVRDATAQSDENGLEYGQMAMILCGISLSTNGNWEEGQLKSALRLVMEERPDTVS